MKKKYRIPLCLLAILLAAVLIVPRVIGRKPFADLKLEDIAGASVRLLPPDETIEITDPEDLEEMTDALNDVVIYFEKPIHMGLAGQNVFFTITYTDGREMVVNDLNSYFVIDGVWYHTEYEPCERLSQFANDLVN